MANKKFKVVYIPWDTEKPAQEWDVDPKGDDVGCLIKRIKKHLQAQGGKVTEEAKKQQLQELQKMAPQATADMLEMLSTMQHVLDTLSTRQHVSMLEMLSTMQHVDSIPLLPHIQASEFEGINLYVDDLGTMKHLPMNPRATGIAIEAGKKIQIMGDAWLARVWDNEDDFKRLDFTLADCQKSAAWFQKARTINASLPSSKQARTFNASMPPPNRRLPTYLPVKRM
eukprot:g57609.t1